MKWNKTGKNYSVSCDGVETTFNLDGMIVIKKFVSQEEAIKFLIINNYKPFDIDKDTPEESPTPKQDDFKTKDYNSKKSFKRIVEK